MLPTIPVLAPIKIDNPIAIVLKKEEPPKEPSLEEKIASNYYNCDTLKQWIWAQDATCHDKLLPYTENTSWVAQNGSSDGNTYGYGYCTHYAKQRRPDLPNSLGNADTWYIRYNGPKGSEPKAGAIGVAKGYMHVVYVESVNTDGTVNISEKNYNGWNVVSSRVAPASEFLYLY